MTQNIQDPTKRYDFMILVDIIDGNPNGDPDNDNTPRQDPETNQGLITDVAIKRKIRNYIEIYNSYNPEGADARRIFVRDGSVLNTTMEEVATEEGLSPRDKKDKSPNQKGADAMCARFFDIRMFGAVLSTGINFGQVRGPVQIRFGRSYDAIEPQDHAITRCAATVESEGPNQTMGRKKTIPYGLYCIQGHYSPFFAQKTGVSASDLEALWDSIVRMWEQDFSSARQFNLRGVWVFQHEDPMGNAPAASLFDTIKVTRRDDLGGEPRHFADYEVTEGTCPEGVTRVKLV